MTLEELINMLRLYPPTQEVPVGFCCPGSYRGSYDELAFEPTAGTTVGKMLACAEDALGTTYPGYKGGQYEMSGDEAWGHVHDMICRHGTQYAVPGRDFEMHPDPAIAARILKALSAVGGWRGVGMLEQVNVADRAAFRSAWNAAGDRARVHRRMGLTGPSRPLLEVT